MGEQQRNSVIDVENLEFRLESTQKAFHVNRQHAIRNHVQLLAISQPYDLLFVGAPYGVKMRVFIMSNLLDAQRNGDGRGVLARVFYLPNQPFLMACNCDGTLLAITYRYQCAGHLHIYKVSSFLRENIETMHDIIINDTRCTLPLQMVWNPKIPNKLATVLTNGRMRVYTFLPKGEYEVDEPKVDCIAKAKSACWSPDGNHIVYGMGNGTLKIFDTHLNPERTITCPSGVYPEPFNTISVHWLTPNKFLVAFLEQGEDKIPTVYLVEARPGATPTYTSFGNVGDSHTGPRAQQVTFTPLAEWNQVLVTPANGREVGVIGSPDNGNNWQLYRLPEQARLKMLTPDDDRIHPGGLVYSKNSPLERSQGKGNKVLAPIVYTISSSGDLRSFSYSNTGPGAHEFDSSPPPFPQPTPSGFEPLKRSTDVDAADEAKHQAAEGTVKETQTEFGNFPNVVRRPPPPPAPEPPQPTIPVVQSKERPVAPSPPPPPVKEEIRPEKEITIRPESKATSTTTLPEPIVPPPPPPPPQLPKASTSEKQTQVGIEQREIGVQPSLQPLRRETVTPAPSRAGMEKQTQVEVHTREIGIQPSQIKVMPPPEEVPKPFLVPEPGMPVVIPPRLEVDNSKGTQVDAEIDSTSPIPLLNRDGSIKKVKPPPGYQRPPKSKNDGSTQTEVGKAPEAAGLSEEAKRQKELKGIFSSETQTDAQIYSTAPIQSVNFWGKKRKVRPHIPASGPIIGDYTDGKNGRTDLAGADKSQAEKSTKTQETQVSSDLESTQPFGKFGKRIKKLAAKTSAAEVKQKKAREVGGTATATNSNLEAASDFSINFNTESDNLVSVSSYYIFGDEIKVESKTFREAAGSEPIFLEAIESQFSLEGNSLMPLSTSFVANITQKSKQQPQTTGVDENPRSQTDGGSTDVLIDIKEENLNIADNIEEKLNRVMMASSTGGVTLDAPSLSTQDSVRSRRQVRDYFLWIHSVIHTDTYLFLSLSVITIFLILFLSLALYVQFR